jgi:hypothetical protein
VRINPNAAGIDVDAKEHVVGVPCDRDPQPVRTFEAFILAGFPDRGFLATAAQPHHPARLGPGAPDAWTEYASRDETRRDRR